MKARPVIPRQQANRDIDDAIAFYLGEGAQQAALDFIDALEQAYNHIGRGPASGSPRYAHELNLPGLRCWPLNRFPDLHHYNGRGGRIYPLWQDAAAGVPNVKPALLAYLGKAFGDSFSAEDLGAYMRESAV